MVLLPKPPPAPKWVVAVAASAGGIPALDTLLSQLPKSLCATVLIVQHMERRRTHSLLAEILARHTDLEVTEAQGGERLENGRAYVAAPNRHLTVTSHLRIELTEGPLEHFVRPSADVLFRSVAERFGPHVIGVVLTGTGSDGAAGATAIHNAGGTIIAQDEATSLHFSMPRAVIATGHADYVLPLESISTQVTALIESNGRS